VDHPLTAPDALIRPWRTAACIAVAIAGVELVILLVIGGGALAGAISGLVEREAVKRVNATTAPSPAKETRVTREPTKVVAKLPRTKVRVLVLNGNGRQGAAAVAAGRVQQRGYRIGGVTNASRSNFARSLVMYRPGFAGEGKRLGRDLGVRQVTPLDGMRPGQLHGAHLVFILGA
jgi:LytR cell envelope-related transcriptional attenuator